MTKINESIDLVLGRHTHSLTLSLSLSHTHTIYGLLSIFKTNVTCSDNFVILFEHIHLSVT